MLDNHCIVWEQNYGLSMIAEGKHQVVGDQQLFTAFQLCDEMKQLGSFKYMAKDVTTTSVP